MSDGAHPGVGEPRGDPRRIGVERLAERQLGADRNDPRIAHRGSVRLRPRTASTSLIVGQREHTASRDNRTPRSLSMSDRSPFVSIAGFEPAETTEVSGVLMATRYGDPAAEYRAARERAAMLDRSHRGLIAVTGADRKAWLHNLVTNTVNTLDDHTGVYAFAIDLHGRVQFDMNILNLPDVIRLDVERTRVSAAIAHLDRYLLSEDVELADVTAEYARLACSGPQARDIAAQLGVPNFPALAALAVVRIEDDALLVRHDLAGDPALELIVPISAAEAWWRRLADAGAAPVGFATADVLRIEAGIPWMDRDIDETVLPPETGQVERGISYHKGCYLGQEIIERMRSRGSLARRLVRIRMNDGEGLTPPIEMLRDGKPAGRITSLARHPVDGDWIGLGYLRTTVSELSGITAGDEQRLVTIVA
ncbi:MAG: folate-binding protein [Planctomycetota bacterium]|nr:MAG: folate-binding protein [Planctomycetota bacterium]